MYCLWCRYCQYWHQLSPEPDEKVREKGKYLEKQLEANFFCEVAAVEDFLKGGAAAVEDGGFFRRCWCCSAEQMVTAAAQRNLSNVRCTRQNINK